jgi:transposase
MEIRLNNRDQRRVEVLRRVCEGNITKAQAQMLLMLSRRQVDRLVTKYRKVGVGSVVHGNRGRVPVNKMGSEMESLVLSLIREGGKYHGFNVCHICDLLFENEGISIGRSSLDRLLRRKGIIKSGSRSTRARRKRRVRASAEGEMLQIDGSPHDWLEGRGPRICLVGAIDDATGKIIYALFRPTEDLDGYLMMLRKISTHYGLPESIYHDRHTILRSPKSTTIDSELSYSEPMSQFQRLLTELGIASIAANSPQAKGRVERLWGVLQDRLVKEMRLAGISSIEEANALLPQFIRRYNRRFSVTAADAQSAWVKMETRVDMAYYFCAKESRVVRSDYTISWHGRIFQITADSRDRPLARESVNIHRTPENEVFLYDRKRRLNYRIVPSVQRQPLPKASRKSQTPNPEGLAKRRGWLFAETAA